MTASPKPEHTDPAFVADSGAPTPTRAAGLARLKAFAPRAGRVYASERNHDCGPRQRDNVSMLSPWIRHRLVREDEVVRRVLDHHRFEEAEKFVQEVVWRTYWKGWLEMRPDVWRRYRCAVDHAIRNLDRDPEQRRRYDDAVAGRMGIAGFDDWATELRTHGYLHNHARMWFASIWIFTLGLPWVLGADFFYRHLLDGDAASNTLSWRWVAGLQTRGKAYLARAENIARYTGGRFADVGPLAATATPPCEAPVAPSLPLSPAPERYQERHQGRHQGSAPFALLVGEDDCDPLSLELPMDLLQGAAGMAFTAARSPLPPAPRPLAFSQGAVADALVRVGDASGCATTLLPAEAGVADVLEWARRTGVRRIVTAHAPVGPGGEWLVSLRPALAEAGVALTAIRRPWDTTLWPYATRGFFAFWQSASGRLHALLPS